MHILQPNHIKLTLEETDKLLQELNISKAQLPKILSTDPALPEGCERGDVIKIERNISNINVGSDASPEIKPYYRVVV